MILIIDDNQENIVSLKSLLTLHKFEVDSATPGEEGLKKNTSNACRLKFTFPESFKALIALIQD